ncbi:very short patch repair endonuclease [Flagellimonas hymeniacidonis]|uniref:Very short patch repair endonuclease n=1 Tax=Flagellimonas hymeniacidonis TaxID=2603628 RepID=A0A5C8V657_9FLAO|nr:very short patch repair endonuclease [Flagellimonas hymeniacidonis]TXN37554.1 very short patch repair endonuclease [Flagellimonas hymeniacidonis]
MPKKYSEERIKVPRFNEESGFYTTPKRSKIMGKIRGKNTKPELAFRKALWAAGYRYRVDYKKLIGKPDIVLNKYKTVIFIDGEFWHGHNWETRKQKIKTNREFWIPKIERNIQRDAEVNAALENLGYTIFRFWETDVKKNLDACLKTVIASLQNMHSND